MTSPGKFFAVLVVALTTSGTVHGDVFTWEATPVSSNWNEALNWAGTANQFPDGVSDTAIVDGVPTNGIDPVLTLNVSVGTLTILNNGDVFLDNFSMFVSGTTTVDGSGSSLDVNDSVSTYDFDTNVLTIGAVSGTATVTVDGAGAILQVDNTLTINSGGVLDIDASEVEVGDDLDVNVGGILRGDGVVQLTGVAGDDFINDGLVQATGGTLRIERTAGSASEFDWDGAGTNGASLTVSSNSTMDIDLPLADQIFGGTITLNTNSTLDVATVWQLSGGGAGTDQGVLNKDGTGVGTVAGSPVTLRNGSEVNVNGGTLVFAADLTGNDDSTINVATGSTLQLDGTANFNQGTSNLNPAGVWSLTVNGDTTIYQTDFNWDGTGALTNVTTVGPGASLTINSDHIDLGANDQFDSRLTINSGTVTVNNLPNNWKMNGVLTLDTAAGAANLSGDSLNVTGPVSATGGGVANINSPIRFEANVSVNVAAGTQLELNGLADFASSTASFTGDGALENNGGMQTLANTTINMPGGTFDLDGDSGDESVTLSSDLVLNVASIDDDGDGVDGTITIADDARLTVNLTGGGSWTLDPGGIITYNGDAGVNHYLAGSDIAVKGTINHSGDGRILARIDIRASGVLNSLSAGLPLILGGGDDSSNPNTIAGGTINGPGYLAIDGNQELRGYGTINADFGFHGTLRADNGTLTFNGEFLGPALDPPIVGTADADGILNVTNAWNTNIANYVELLGGQITGADITNAAGKTIRGYGSILANQVHNEGTIAADGGELTLDFTLAPNLDGNFAAGILEAINGDLTVVDALPGSDPFNGTINVGPGRTINFMGGWGLQRAANVGVLNLDGGATSPEAARVLGGLQVLQGDVNVDQESHFLAATDFLISVNVNLPDADDTLRLFADTTVSTGATFTGSGRLVNEAGNTLTLADNVQVGVRLENSGNLVIGTSVGQAQGSSFQQSASGTWDVELDGTGLDEYDRLVLTGAASLAGTLDLSLVLGFLPALGDTFTVLSAAGGLGGTTFGMVSQPAGMPVGRFLSAIYGPTTVQLLVISNLPGDYNNDGAVDAADYAVWRNNLGQSVTLPNDSSPGTVTQADYNEWRAHFGQTAGSGAAVSVNAAVPEPATPVLVILVAVVGSSLFTNRLREVNRRR